MAKMRHNCEASGCYLERLHPPIHLFDDCFPGRIEMSNLDGIVEHRGQVLFLEWKSPSASRLSMGQGITLDALSRLPGCTVYLVAGPVREAEAETATLRVTRWGVGTAHPPRLMSLEDLRAEFTAWYQKAHRS